MKKTTIQSLPYLLVHLCIFYLLPLCIVDTGTAILILLVVTPSICFVTSIVWGKLHQFHWQYAVLVSLLFLPTLYIYYNESATIYVIAYGIIACIGNVIGSFFGKKKKQ